LLLLQVEAWFNQLLDRSAALRDSLGQGGDAVSLQSSLDGLWSRREARVRRHEQQQQRSGSVEQVTANGHHSNGYLASSAGQQQQQEQQRHGSLQQAQQQPSVEQQQQRQQQEGYREQPPLLQQQQQRLADSLGTQQARHLLMQWHLANIEFANATRLRRLSMRVRPFCCCCFLRRAVCCTA
jgi:hypothetical protein